MKTNCFADNSIGGNPDNRRFVGARPQAGHPCVGEIRSLHARDGDARRLAKFHSSTDEKRSAKEAEENAIMRALTAARSVLPRRRRRTTRAPIVLVDWPSIARAQLKSTPTASIVRPTLEGGGWRVDGGWRVGEVGGGREGEESSLERALTLRAAGQRDRMARPASEASEAPEAKKAPAAGHSRLGVGARCRAQRQAAEWPPAPGPIERASGRPPHRATDEVQNSEIGAWAPPISPPGGFRVLSPPQ